jgi:N-acetylglucosaminyl-diphospho-decaprenol L-rhamnosyltransferase
VTKGRATLPAVAEPPHSSLVENDATAVLVNYNSGSRLGPLLESLEPEVRSIVIVDNASADRSADQVEARPKAQLIRNQANLGFAAAANQGAAGSDSAWLLFVNPDVHLRPGDVTMLLKSLPEDVAAVAPLQVDAEGTPKPETGGYRPTLGRYLVWAALPVRLHRQRGPWLAPPWPDRDTELDWVSGALLGIRRTVFEELGGFDERFFLYHEDVDFGGRARRAGYRVLCRPGVQLHHEVAHGDPTRRVASGLRSVESLALAFTGWRRRALGAILLLGFGLRAALGSGIGRDLARAALPHARALVAGRIPERTLPSVA